MIVGRVLFITTDGLTDPLGQSQILPYLQGLAGEYEIHILSCEKQEAFSKGRARIQKIVDEAGIRWHVVHYRNTPPVLGSWLMQRELRQKAAGIVKEYGIKLLHCRSYPAGIIGMGLGRKYGIPWLFDMRGFWADERVDRHIWNIKNPLYWMLYKWFKHKEKQLFKRASHIISLTYKGREIIQEKFGVAHDKVMVIPCASDLQHFKRRDEGLEEVRAELGLRQGQKLLVYLGSLGSCYLLREMLEFYRIGLEGDQGLRMAFFSPQDWHGRIRQEAQSMGLDADGIICRFLGRESLPLFLSVADYGVMFFEKSFSIQASSPTKHGEMLGMHIPVVTNAGVGDLERIISERLTGVVVQDFSEVSMRKAWAKLRAQNFRTEDFDRVAGEWYELEKGIKKYGFVFKGLIK